MTNKEILDRCREAKIESGNLDVPVKFGSPDWSAPFSFTCKRTNYSVVRVHTVGHNAEFVAYPYVERETFDATPLYQLPTSLKEFSFQKESASSDTDIIDFSAYLEACVVLNDDVLLPLLVLLKEHLEAVQVCLGKIEQWIMDAKHALSFLQSTFGYFLIVTFGGVAPTRLLKSIPICGNIQLSFDVSDETDRDHLLQCVAFVESIKDKTQKNGFAIRTPRNRRQLHSNLSPNLKKNRNAVIQTFSYPPPTQTSFGFRALFPPM